MSTEVQAELPETKVEARRYQFIVSGEQLVSPKSIEEWRAALDPKGREMRELEAALERPWNKKAWPTGNLRIPPAIITRIVGQTGIEAEVRLIRGDGKGYLDNRIGNQVTHD